MENQEIQTLVEAKEVRISKRTGKPIKQYVYTKKTGRKTPFDTLDIKNVQKLILHGFSDREIADFIGVTRVTYHGWKSKHKSFFTDIEQFKKEQNNNVKHSLYQRCVGYEHEAVKFFMHKGKIKQAKYIEHYPPDAECLKYWLNNREPDEWKEKILVDSNIKHYLHEDLKDIPTEQLQKRVQELANRLITTGINTIAN